MFSLAFTLSERFSAETLARSLDILHVAAAISIHSDLLITDDRRQKAVAEKSGLATKILE